VKKYLERDVIAGLLLIVLGAIYYFMSDSLPRSLLSDRVGADGFPKLLAVTLIAFSVVLILQSVIRQKTSPVQREEATNEGYRFLKAAGMLAIGIGYLVIVSFIGYMVSIALLLTVALRYQGEPVSRRVLLTAVLGGIFFWAFFVFALKTPMPAGIWPALLAGK